MSCAHGARSKWGIGLHACQRPRSTLGASVRFGQQEREQDRLKEETASCSRQSFEDRSVLRAFRAGRWGSGPSHPIRMISDRLMMGSGVLVAPDRPLVFAHEPWKCSEAIPPNPAHKSSRNNRLRQQYLTTTPKSIMSLLGRSLEEMDSQTGAKSSRLRKPRTGRDVRSLAPNACRTSLCLTPTLPRAADS